MIYYTDILYFWYDYLYERRLIERITISD